MKNIKTVVILGAGASYDSFKLPLDSQFFKVAIKKFKSNIKYKKLFVFVDYLFSNTNSYPGMEEFFNIIETSIKWIEYANKIHPEIKDAYSRGFLPLPYMPITPALNSNEETLHGIDNFKKNKKGRIYPYVNYNIEKLQEHQDFLSRLLCDKNKDEKIFDGYNVISYSMYKLKEKLIELIYETFMLYCNKENDSCYYNICESHKKLFDKLYNGLAVISFNYDLIGDTAFNEILIEKGNWEWDPERFYMQNFDPSPRIVKDKPNPLKKDTCYLKLHGSMNWFLTSEKENNKQFICYSNKKNKLNKPSVPLIDYINKKKYEPVIIPPILDKFSYLEKKNLAGHHGRSWTVAFDALLKANRWIFFGYSLPITDFHANWLFKFVFAYKLKNNNPLQIDIINPCDSTPLQEYFKKIDKKGFKLNYHTCIHNYLRDSKTL